MYQDQATELRAMMHRAGSDKQSGSARVVAITSGKGGVGKSNVAVNLAARLAKMGRNVVLLDADMGMANADVLCNVAPRATLAHVVAGRRQLEEAMVEAPGGFTLIPGASGLAQMANLSEFERARVVNLFRQLEDQHDLLLIDTGAGIGPNVMSFLLAAQELLVVTTPEPTAVTDAYALIKAVSRQRESVTINLLVNMARDREEARRVYERISAVTRRFLGHALSDAGYVLYDPRVGASVRRRCPFVLDAPDAPASLCIKQLAHKLDRHATEPGQGGFFKKVASWLAG
ncbi:MAG: AAA family ATPase [Planctomycetes bacterium]|nr:AAA family ATPase [Planctomycetota bacterium]